MKYTSTRDSGLRTDAAEAILTGLAPDGGLFVPTGFGMLELGPLLGKSYAEVALEVLQLFLPDYSPLFLKEAIDTSYGANFGGKAGELVCLSEGLYALELWHGPTAAFKDYALQLMPKLLVEAKRMLAEKSRTLILVATSGDTGKAALEGYKDLEGILIDVFYPQDGTSELQRLQMATQDGNNVAVFAVQGNFDDAQRGVKKAFVDEELREKLAAADIRLSSANSINWGRLVPQIVYYVTSYLEMVGSGAIEMGRPVDYCVPTGNFGDILAGWYAKSIGLPVGRLICASNQNNVLSDFFSTGRYDAKREFYKTSSPSMDILVSSNLERLLYHMSGSDTLVRKWMGELTKTGEYQIPGDVLAAIRQSFAAGWADEEAVAAEIARIYDEYRYLCDPHTAVGFRVLRDVQGELRDRPAIVLSTASPYKFSGKVLEALGQPVPSDAFEAMAALERHTGAAAPASLTSLRDKPVRFTRVVQAEEIPALPLERCER